MLQGILVRHGNHGIIEPFAAHPGEDGGLADALGTWKDKANIELDAGRKDSGNSRLEEQFGGFPRVLVIRCAEIVHQQGGDTGFSVPYQPCPIIFHLVKGMAVHRFHQSVINEGFARQPFVGGGDIVPQLGIVTVPPHIVPVHLPPGEVTLEENTVTKVVKPRHAFEPRVVFQNQEEVGHRRDDLPLPGTLQLGEPVRADGFGIKTVVVQKIIGDTFGQNRPHLLVPVHEVAHGEERGVLVDGRPFLHVAVHLAIKVEPHKVKGIDIKSADGIGGMMAVAKKVIVVDNHARRGGTLGVCVTVGNIAGDIDLG